MTSPRTRTPHGRFSTPQKAPIAGSFSDLFLILQQHGIEHLATHIADCGFGVSDLGNVFHNEQDVRRLLRVTNRSDRQRLCGLASHIRNVDGRYLATVKSDDAGADVASGDEHDGGTATPARGVPRAASTIGGASTTSTQAAVAQQTFLYKVPTTATANEYCRQAATFLEHYRVDRAWPKKRSTLSRTLGLPTAAEPLTVKERAADGIAAHQLPIAGEQQRKAIPSPPTSRPGTAQRTNSPPNRQQQLTTSTEGGETPYVEYTDGEEVFKVYQRPARHFTVPTDDAARLKHEKALADREEALRTGKFGGSWKEVGQKHPDKGGPLDPFPTAKGPSLEKLHALHAHDHGDACGHSPRDTMSTAGGGGYLYDTHIVHQHGCQARQCPVCKNHARQKSGDGCWQYLAMVRVPKMFDASAVTVEMKALLRAAKNKQQDTIIGEDGSILSGGDVDADGAPIGRRFTKDGEELVPMWVPFPAADSLVLETAYRQKAVTILVRGKVANLKKMRWNKRPLRRSHAGDVPFPIDHGLKGSMFGYSDSDEEDDEEAARKAEEAERMAAGIRDSFLKLLDAEEGRSRATIEAEADTTRRGILADMDRISRQIYNNLLENLIREEEAARRAIRTDEARLFEERIAAPLADQLRQEEVRRLARQEIAAAQKILQQQRALVEDHERNGRRAIEAEEADEWNALERAIKHLNAQIALFHQQLEADRNPTNQHGMGDDGTRCAKCLDSNCPFHRKPWAGHWRRVGGALDLKPTALGIDTLDGFIATATTKQYQELAGGNPAGAWGGASAVAKGAAGGGAAAAQHARARGTSSMRYHAGGGPSTARSPKRSSQPAFNGLETLTASAAARIVQANGGSHKVPQRPQSARNRQSDPSASSLGQGVASSYSRSHSSAGRQQQQPAAAPPQQQQQQLPSSNYNHPAQPPARVLRQEEDRHKPAPFKHGGGVLDQYDVYRSADQSDRSTTPPVDGGIMRRKPAVPITSGAASRSPSRVGSNWIPPASSSAANPAPPVRRKMARNGDDAGGVAAEEDAPSTSSLPPADLAKPKPLAFGGGINRVIAKAAPELRPMVTSHAEKLRRAQLAKKHATMNIAI